MNKGWDDHVKTLNALVTVNDVVNYFKNELKVTNVKTMIAIENEEFTGPAFRAFIVYYKKTGVPVDQLRLVFELPYGKAYQLSMFLSNVAFYL